MREKILFIAILLVLLVPMMVSAGQFEFDPGNRIAGTLELATTNPEDITINAVRWALGSLGLIAVIVILYGGFTWMTAAGNEEKVSKAKNIITYAVIGLAVILLSFVLVSTIFKTSANVSGLYVG